MKHYVVYHNTAKNGPLSSTVGNYVATARKPIKHLAGQRVWIISGEGKASPKSYYLRLVFTPADIIPGMPNRAVGSTGRLFTPPVKLDSLPWFKELFEQQNHFKNGAQLIPDEFVEELEAIAASAP